MKLVPPSSAVKAWRRALRVRVRTSRTMKREHRAASVPYWRRDHAWSALRWLVPPVIFMVVASGFSAEQALNQLLLWSLLILFVRTQQVAALGFSPDSHWLHFLWPVTNDDVYRHSRSLVLKSSLWLGLDWTAFGCALAWRAGDPWLIPVGLLLGSAQAAAHLCAATWLATARPRFGYATLILPLALLTFFSPKLQSFEGVIGKLASVLWVALHTATPGGWIAWLWRTALDTGGGLAGGCALAAICGLLFWLLRGADQKLRAGFSLETLFAYETGEAVAERLHGELSAEPRDEDFDDTAPAPQSEPPAPADIERLRDVITTTLATPAGRTFLGRGPVESVVGRLLGGRDRVLVDFFAATGMTWLRRWLISAGLVLMTLLASTLAPGFAIFPALLAMVIALPVFGGAWRGFENTRAFGAQIALNAYLPIGFGETSRLLLKTNALHCAGALPLVLLAVHWGLAPAGAPMAWTLDYSLRGIGLVLALQPVWLLGRFSGNTNDSSSRGLLLALAVFLGIFVLIGGVTLCVVALMAERFQVAILCVAALAMMLHAMLVVYGWLWGRNVFDLMARQR